MKTLKRKASHRHAPKRRVIRRSRAYPYDLKLKVVQLHLQEGYSLLLFAPPAPARTGARADH